MKDRSGKAGHIAAYFIEPMLCLDVEKLPEGPAWQYEVKLDGYRAIAVRTKTGVELWSRNKRDFSSVSQTSRAPSKHCRSRLFSMAKSLP